MSEVLLIKIIFFGFILPIDVALGGGKENSSDIIQHHAWVLKRVTGIRQTIDQEQNDRDCILLV